MKQSKNNKEWMIETTLDLNYLPKDINGQIKYFQELNNTIEKKYGKSETKIRYVINSTWYAYIEISVLRKLTKYELNTKAENERMKKEKRFKQYLELQKEFEE